MNEKARRHLSVYGLYLFVFLLGLFIGGGSTGYYYNQSIERLSGAISAGEKLNAQLRDTNTRLTEQNIFVQSRIGELEREIISRDQRNKEILTSIGGGLGDLAKGLSGSAGTLQDIIIGIEQIKRVIGSLATLE